MKVEDRRSKIEGRSFLFFVLCSLFLISGCTLAPVAVTSTPTPDPQSPTAAAPTPTPDPDVVAFPNGHTIRGAFRRFWQAGAPSGSGATLFGSPLTEALWIDGKTVQYFERARFELGDDGAVTLGKVGAEALAVRRRSLALDAANIAADVQQRQRTPPVPPINDPGCQFFAAASHNLCGAFRAFWQRRGGEAIFGQPISEVEITNRTEVQYFERARFEQPLGGDPRLAPVGDEALARVPANSVLRASAAVPSPERATLDGLVDVVQPLQTVRALLTTAPITTTATLFWGDTQGRSWADTIPVAQGRAEVTHMAQGALGMQGAVIMLGGKVAGVNTQVYKLDAASAIQTGQSRFDELLPRVRAFMEQDVSEYTFGQNKVRGYRSPDNNLLWLRDHVQQGKGYAYWEPDMTSLLDQFRRYQRPDGSFDDYLGNFPTGEVRGREEVEADLEYLFVEGVYRAWQATGDDDWLRQQIGAMERGLMYATSNPLRWDAEKRLVKRPFTIDTWDFEIGSPTISPDGRVSPRHWIDAQTKWSIFYGDNLGYAQAMNLLARMYDRLGDAKRAAYWRAEAKGLIERINALAWNGRFYRHMVHLTPVNVPVDEAQQLSLSNAYALNRNVLTAEQAATILDEYQKRRRPPDQAFAEWYSIDPPFPSGVTSMPPGTKGYNPGEYVNGGIMPLVGGELAQGAFRYGAESYGFDILGRYYSLIAGAGKSYLWYYPIGQPGISGPDTLPTDGWGASAMLAGLIEGAAGVQDQGTAFSSALIAPRWAATPDVTDATVIVRYGASDGYVAYRWQREANALRIVWTGSGDMVKLHLLLPNGAPANARVELNGQATNATAATIGSSRYLDLNAPPSGQVTVRW